MATSTTQPTLNTLAPITPKTRIKSEAKCSKGSVVLYSPGSNIIKVIPALCKSWTCPHCAPIKQRVWAKRLAAGKPFMTMTLTTKFKSWASPQREAKRMKRAWTCLVQRIRRQFGWFEYALVWELQKNGMPHAHILARSPYIPKPWLKKQWFELTGAYMVAISRVKKPHAVAKHHCKSLHDSSLQPGYSPERLTSKQTSQTARALAPMRIIQLSAGYEKPPGQDKTEEKKERVLCVFSLASSRSLASSLAASVQGNAYYVPYASSYEVTSPLPADVLLDVQIMTPTGPVTFRQQQDLDDFFDGGPPMAAPVPETSKQTLLDFLGEHAGWDW